MNAFNRYNKSFVQKSGKGFSEALNKYTFALPQKSISI